MSKYSTKFKIIIASFIAAVITFVSTNVVGVQNYEVVKKTVPTVLPTVIVSPTAVPTASPSATVVPFRRVVTQPVANPSK